MPSPSNKKLILLYIYNILKEYSDENHPLKHQDIIDKIYLTYGMECERKAIASNLLSLEDCGFDIINIPNKGTYLGQRGFEPSEVSFLVDAVFSSKEINSKQSQMLAEKLFSDFSLYQRKKYNYVYKANQITRTDNKQLFYVIDTINRAIEQHKRIAFQYVSYSFEDGKTSKAAKVSPYYLVNNNGKYYLVCARHRAWGLSNYRVERMEYVEITDEDSAPLDTVKGCDRNFDIAEYANEKIYMFAGESVNADILVKKENSLAYIFDWFGRDVRVRKDNDQIIATVLANESALIYWILQYGEHMELLSPEKTREKLKQKISGLMNEYNMNEDVRDE